VCAFECETLRARSLRLPVKSLLAMAVERLAHSGEPFKARGVGARLSGFRLGLCGAVSP
jgi:hypothetical protein